MVRAIPVNIIRYGAEAPLPPRTNLRAGPVTAVLEGGDLRYVSLGDTEIVRRIYMAVRDQNWGTIEPTYTSFTVENQTESFRVEFTAEHVSAEVDFAWTGVIEGREDGTITYSLDGAPRKSFFRNRIGFCVLHPSDLAGQTAHITTPSGQVDGVFPVLIAPDQPFLNMQEISHPAGEGAQATIRFTGDVFEMEDQRNWTDASYKTYSTPLSIPYPVEVDPSTHIVQTVQISVTGEMLVPKNLDAPIEPVVTVDPGSFVPLPPIGFGAGLPGTIDDEDMERLAKLAPSHLFVTLDLGDDSWHEILDAAAARAVELKTTLDVSAVAAPGNGGWGFLADRIASQKLPIERVFVFPPVTYPITFPRSDLATHPETIRAAKAAFSNADLDISPGGGTLAYFTELNRAQSFLPVDELESVTFTITPQVHAFDNLSLVECIDAQIENVESARAIAGDKPLVVGPVTLRPPFNPNATGPAPEPGPNELPPEVDHRQMSLFGASWTLGSIRRLAETGVAAMTYYELYGWRGLIERRHDLTKREIFPSEPGQLFPLYHVFSVVQACAGGDVAAVETSHPRQVDALALRKDVHLSLLVGSFAEEEIDLTIRIPDVSAAQVVVLDETTYSDSLDDPDFLSTGGTELDLTSGSATIRLKPFAVALIDSRIGS